MINNEGFDASADGLSAMEIGVCACETVYTVINVCQNTWLKCGLWDI